jgi:hypothetical protein
MKNDSKNPAKLPYAILTQWKAAQREDTPTEWAYVAGMIGGEISRNPCHELMTAHNSAMKNATTAASQASTGKYSLLTAQERIQELLTITARMKSHAAILSQFFTRSSTKQAAIAGMNAEVENMLVLWEKIKADVEEMGAQQ